MVLLMKVQVLYFAGCPNYRRTIDLIRSIARDVEVEEVEVHPTDDAAALRFLGSPTVLVDRVDVEPSASTRTDFGFSCRTYEGRGTPSAEMIVRALTHQARD